MLCHNLQARPHPEVLCTRTPRNWYARGRCLLTRCRRAKGCARHECGRSRQATGSAAGRAPVPLASTGIDLVGLAAVCGARVAPAVLARVAVAVQCSRLASILGTLAGCLYIGIATYLLLSLPLDLTYALSRHAFALDVVAPLAIALPLAVAGVVQFRWGLALRCESMPVHRLGARGRRGGAAAGPPLGLARRRSMARLAVRMGSPRLRCRATSGSR